MDSIFCSSEWLKKFEKEVQESTEYKKLASGWKGSVVLQILADPEAGIKKDLFIFMDLENGECYSIKLVPQEKGELGDNIIKGEYQSWKKVLKGEMDIMWALLTPPVSKISLKKGNTTMILKYKKAALMLVKLAAKVGARFPDEISPEERKNFEAELESLNL